MQVVHEIWRFVIHMITIPNAVIPRRQIAIWIKIIWKERDAIAWLMMFVLIEMKRIYHIFRAISDIVASRSLSEGWRLP